MPLTLADLVGAVLSFFLTLMVFSYILGDNPFFRFAIYLFIGVASGYAAVVTIYNVILPNLVVPLFSPNREQQLIALIPLVLSLLFLTKIFPFTARWGNPSMAYLVGVAAAVAIGGAALGTLFPQITASTNLLNLGLLQQIDENLTLQLINGSLILLGTLTTLAYFHFSVRTVADEPTARPAWIDWLAGIGRIFIAVTFGFVFAGVYAAALTALVERLHFMVTLVSLFLTALVPS